MLDPDYLDEEERIEHDALGACHEPIITYGRFAREFGWDEEKVDRQRDGYLNDMLSYLSAFNRAQGRMMDPERRKMADTKSGKSVLKGRSIQQIRDDWGLDSATDDEILAMLKGQQSED